MMKIVNLVKLQKDSIGGVGVFLFALISFWIAAPLDPEPYHDGSQLPAAIGVADGLTLHKDVFSAYGFLTGWFQGGAIWIFGHDLVVIRYFTALAVAVVAVLTYALARWVSRSVWIAIGVALLWIVTWPGRAVIWGTPFLPWPSVLYLVFQLTAVLLLARALLIPRRQSLVLAFAGASAGLALLTRINYGVALCLALLITFVIFFKPAKLKSRHGLIAVAGFFAAVVIPLTLVYLQGAFGPFIDQSITGPLQGKAIVKATEWFYLKNAYLWGSGLLLACIVLFAWIGYVKRFSNKAYAALVFIVVVGLTIWSSSAIDASRLRNFILGRLTWSPALDGQAMQPLFLAAVLSLCALVILVAKIVAYASSASKKITFFTEPINAKQMFFALLTLAGAASLVQLYPIADPNHLWWAAPICLVLLVSGIELWMPRRVRMAIAALIVLPAVLISIFTWNPWISKPRVEIGSGALAGMKISAAYSSSVQAVDDILKGVEPGSAAFICKEGLFSVWDGTYLASSPGYVDYSYGVTPSSPSKTKSTFMCVPWGDVATAKIYAQGHGLKIAEESGRVQLSYFTDINIVKMIPVDQQR